MDLTRKEVTGRRHEATECSLRRTEAGKSLLALHQGYCRDTWDHAAILAGEPSTVDQDRVSESSGCRPFFQELSLKNLLRRAKRA